jgi:hypothetical protein
MAPNPGITDTKLVVEPSGTRVMKITHTARSKAMMLKIYLIVRFLGEMKIEMKNKGLAIHTTPIQYSPSARPKIPRIKACTPKLEEP